MTSNLTTQDKLSELTEAICRVVPELQGVHVGCYLTGNGYHKSKVLWVHENHPFMFSATVYRTGDGIIENIDFDKKEMKIEPRDLTLEDVLRSIGREDNESLKRWGVTKRSMEVMSRWCLGQPLSSQPEETILWLHSLLCK